MNLEIHKMEKVLAQGAEAKIILSNGFVIKDRISKSYRIPELDKKIRDRRTRAEAKLLEKAYGIINCPKPFLQPSIKGSTKLKMPFIYGKKLSEHLDNFSLSKQKQTLHQIGKDIAKLHQADIIHGDLTTSNMILVEDLPVHSSLQIDKKNINQSNSEIENNSLLTKSSAKQLDEVSLGKISCVSVPIISFIDFGLGYFNGKYEDKAVDIHLLKQALEAKHFLHWKELFAEFEKGYSSINKSEAEKVFQRLNTVEKRGRYKH